MTYKDFLLSGGHNSSAGTHSPVLPALLNNHVPLQAAAVCLPTASANHAAQSFVHGLFVRQFDPAAVALHTSRGYETYFSKQLLRWTVILSDLLSKHTGWEQQQQSPAQPT
jgi:hypothetical protein